MLENFRTYQQSKELLGRCEGLKARGYVKDQLLRAALSVVLNLAEGSAKPTPKERRRFYAIALGSLREVQAILDLLKRPEEFAIADRVGAGLYRLTYSSDN
ncbi:MAG: four helix bundle protein [Pseudomonadota bacterium]